MKKTFRPCGAKKFRPRISSSRRRAYRSVVWLASLACCRAATAQTNSVPGTPSPNAGTSTNVTKLENVTVVGKLDVARNQIVPDLGATVYTQTADQIALQPQGQNAPFNQVLLRAPGMAQDSSANGDLHLRGEHANIQYRINDVLLPEGITGFGQELDTRFVDSLRLITGSLPAQYGFRTAGVVDIDTKSGAFQNGGAASVYGGSYDTIKPAFEYGGSHSNFNYYVDGSFEHNSLGIENPTASAQAIHDQTDQYKFFTYASYVLDDTSRFSVMGSLSYADFQVPNTPGLPPGTNSNGTLPWSSQMAITNFDSTQLNENQNEQNYYAVAAYQKSAGPFNLQVAGYGRVSSVHFKPDPVGDLFFDGVASNVKRTLYSGGLQADTSYEINDKHIMRGGMMLLDESVSADTTTSVFPVDGFGGDPTGPATSIVDNAVAHALFFGLYLQDEWKITPRLTLNYGGRFDLYSASFDHENQPSPRVNLIYQPTDSTTLHAGYARYFTPPPLENVSLGTINKFDNTSNASAITNGISSVKAERANYFDVGISQKLAPGLQVGVDGYYKTAHNQLDDGLFGQTLILSAFNYDQGRIHGVEFTGSYAVGGFSTYANLAWSVAQGKDWNSAQFLFDPGDLAYVKNHWIYLDHDQRITGSFGAAYVWKESFGATRVYLDALYGSGLRQDGGGTEDSTPDGAPIPNGSSVSAYYTISLGTEQDFQLRKSRLLRARVDVVNLTDNIYQLRSGSGVGVNAAQYGMRFGVFGTLSYVF
jgi:outer membrane receptor protein involved in Fe transport